MSISGTSPNAHMVTDNQLLPKTAQPTPRTESYKSEQTHLSSFPSPGQQRWGLKVTVHLKKAATHKMMKERIQDWRAEMWPWGGAQCARETLSATLLGGGNGSLGSGPWTPSPRVPWSPQPDGHNCIDFLEKHLKMVSLWKMCTFPVLMLGDSHPRVRN